MKNVNGETLTDFLEFAYEYAEKKYKETHGTTFTGRSGKVYDVGISTNIYGDYVRVEGEFYNGLEDDTVEVIYIRWDEILEAYNNREL
jgi:hypothetical protein